MLTQLIVHRLIPAALLVLAVLVMMGNSDRPWLIIVANIGVLSLYIFWNAVVIKRLDEERMRAVQLKLQLIGIVSHELRSPLAVIKGAIEVVAEGMDGPVTVAQKHRLEVASRNVDRLNRLVTNVLDYQKLEAGHIVLAKAPCDVSKLIQKTVSDFAPLAAEKNVVLLSDVKAGLPLVNANEDTIIQVLTNLINNAIKFTDHGQITVGAQVRGNEMLVGIQDAGIGIRKEDIPKLFKSFSQVHEDIAKHPGTGLGLVISKRIVELHSGKIWVESSPGQGSTFYFTLPLETKPASSQ